MRTFAEWALPGHVDKISDRIADGIVDAALAIDPKAVVGIEVAIHRNQVFIDGQIACPKPKKINFEKIVRDVFRESDYGGKFLPDPKDLEIKTDLSLEDVNPTKKYLRSVTRDQSIITGYAEFNPKTNYLPFASFTAYVIARALDEMRKELPEKIGSDGKVLAVISHSTSANSPADLMNILESLNISIHHHPSFNTISILTFAKKVLKKVNEEFLWGENIVPYPTKLLVNGAGDFSTGGPKGDNGLSGKKIVIDAYGPHVPVGGGAFSGKDPYKVDRMMALRARQIAKHIVIAGCAERVLVHLAFASGDREPRWKEIQLGTVNYDENTTTWKMADESFAQRWLSGYDLTIEGTFNDLDLSKVLWTELAKWGHFTDPNLPWERWNPGRV